MPQLIKIDQVELDSVIRKHAMFRAGRVGGARAVLAYHDLSYMEFDNQDLSHADFTGAVLYQAKLNDAKMDYAVLYGADLRQANLQSTSLVRADMRGVCLRGANW